MCLFQALTLIKAVGIFSFLIAGHLELHALVPQCRRICAICLSNH